MSKIRLTDTWLRAPQDPGTFPDALVPALEVGGLEFGKGAAGHWQDRASGEFRDLLDVIQLSLGLASFPECSRRRAPS